MGLLFEWKSKQFPLFICKIANSKDYSLLCKEYKMKCPMNVYYDEEGDFLEISIGKPTKCYAEEVKPGIFLRKDEKTNDVRSIGIVIANHTNI